MPDSAAMVNRKNLANALWPPDAWSFMKTWVILDAARDERIYKAVDRSYQEKCCLFAGNISPQLKAVAPYLIRFDKDDDLANFVLDNGWGNAWGIFFSSQASLGNPAQAFPQIPAGNRRIRPEIAVSLLRPPRTDHL